MEIVFSCLKSASGLAKLALSLALLFTAPKAHAGSWFDQSHEALIPKTVGEKLLNYREFPVFWWNFIILQYPSESSMNLSELRLNCGKLVESLQPLIRRSPCVLLSEDNVKLLRDWSRDYPLRHEALSRERLESLYSQTLAKASLPLDKKMLNVMRFDPFDSLNEFRRQMESRLDMGFENHDGLLVDPKTHRVLIPVQFNAIPSETIKFKTAFDAFHKICDGLDCQYAGSSGPHAATWENESQIMSDVSVVSSVGWIILGLMSAFFIFTRRWRLLLLFVPLVIAMGLAGLVCFLVFGKLHGLTLAFGPSIVGLAIDYGLYGSFAKRDDKSVWVANFFGMLTTCSIFIALLFSQLPILNQIAVFAIVGLVVALACFYLFKISWPHYFHEKAFQFQYKEFRPMAWLSAGLVALSIAALLFLRADLSLQRLNYEGGLSTEMRTWIYSAQKAMNPQILITKAMSLQTLNDEAQRTQAASARGLQYEGVGQYLPGFSQLQNNMKTWSPELCQRQGGKGLAHEFFAPYWSMLAANANCDGKGGLSDNLLQAAYLSDIHAGDSWVHLWFPKNESDLGWIRNQYPEARSFADIVGLFSETLRKELSWMMPVAMLLAIAFLIYCFPSVVNCALALLPFFTGLGAYYLVVLVFAIKVSFISVIGLIMMFGFSLDYGIFVVSVFTKYSGGQSDGLWTSITLASLTTVLGFTPLIFAKHPALQHLGQALLSGGIGTYIGAVWGIPTFYRFYQLRKTRRQAAKPKHWQEQKA